MQGTSTTLIFAAAIGVAFGFALAWWLRRAKPAEPIDPRQTYLREQSVRLFLAQHWARGGAFSFASEAWRPCMTALGFAALVVRDPSDLDALLDLAARESADDPELANIWEQARGELAGARRREWVPLQGLNELERESEIRVSLGKTLKGTDDWNYPELGNRAREALLSSCLGARKLLAIRREPSVRPPG